MNTLLKTPALLGPNDPPVFDHINPAGQSPLVLICDHAGRSVPQSLGNLGVDAEQFERHIAYDIGAAAVTRRLSKLLDATAILHNYSRLVIDCNRALGHPDSMPTISDETPIPANEDMSEQDAQRRGDALFWPYHQTISNAVARLRRINGKPPILFTIHSFSAGFGSEPRPWHAGVIYHRDDRMAKRMLTTLGDKGLNIGDNEPYSGFESAYSVDLHGLSAGLANTGIEIRQDQITDQAGQELWAQYLCECFTDFLKDDDLFSDLR
jgi:predicted N-formylglutamate amidohydrolase